MVLKAQNFQFSTNVALAYNYLLSATKINLSENQTLNINFITNK